MLNRSVIIAGLASLALAASPAIPASMLIPQPVMSKRRRQILAAGSAFDSVVPCRKSTGMTVARQKRAAKKMRNRARHKAALRS